MICVCDRRLSWYLLQHRRSESQRTDCEWSVPAIPRLVENTCALSVLNETTRPSLAYLRVCGLQSSYSIMCYSLVSSKCVCSAAKEDQGGSEGLYKCLIAVHDCK